MPVSARGGTRSGHAEPPRRASLLDDLDPESRRRFQGTADTGLGAGRVLLRLPALLRAVGSLAYQASPAKAVELLFAVLGSACCGVVVLLSTRPLISALVKHAGSAPDLHRVLPPLAAATCATAARAALDSLAALRRAEVLPRVQAIAEERLHTLTLEVELSAFDDPHWQNSLYQARSYGTRNAPRACDLLAQLAGWSARLAAAVVTAAVISPPLAAVLLIATLPEAWVALHAVQHARQGRHAATALNRRVRVITDLFSVADTAAEVRVLTARTALLERFRRLSAAAEQEETAMGRSQARAEAVGRVLGGLGTVVTYSFLGLLLMGGALTPAEAMTAVLAIRTGQSTLRSGIAQTGSFFEAGGYVADFQEFLRDSAARRYLSGGRPAPADGFSEIEVSNLGFTYPGAARPALDALSFTLRRGQVVALVGENGSGKTTLAKLLVGLYPAQRGTIRWDGTDITTFEPHSLHEQIAVVTQRPTRWPFTVRENIEIGRHDRHDPGGHALHRAARNAGCAELIAALPEGYDTPLSKKLRNGQELSGGQWQRLSLARGFYRNAPLTIFDEPTSALDPRAEARMLTDLATLRSENRTVILITHRLAAARHCDSILVLRNGTLAESGSHEELLLRQGPYAAMYEIQRSAYTSQDRPHNNVGPDAAAPGPTLPPPNARPAPADSP